MSNWQQLLDLLDADVVTLSAPCLFPCCPCPPCVLFMPQQSIVYNSFWIVYNSLGIVYNSFRIVYNVYHWLPDCVYIFHNLSDLSRFLPIVKIFISTAGSSPMILFLLPNWPDWQKAQTNIILNVKWPEVFADRKICGSRLTGEQAVVSHDYSSSTPSGETRMIGNWSKQTFPSTNKSEIICSNWKDMVQLLLHPKKPQKAVFHKCSYLNAYFLQFTPYWSILSLTWNLIYPESKYFQLEDFHEHKQKLCKLIECKGNSAGWF